jgi:hypothetical protein
MNLINSFKGARRHDKHNTKPKFFLQISDHQQRVAPARPLPGAFLIPPALLVVADLH